MTMTKIKEITKVIKNKTKTDSRKKQQTKTDRQKKEKAEPDNYRRGQEHLARTCFLSRQTMYERSVKMIGQTKDTNQISNLFVN